MSDPNANLGAAEGDDDELDETLDGEGAEGGEDETGEGESDGEGTGTGTEDADGDAGEQGDDDRRRGERDDARGRPDTRQRDRRVSRETASERRIEARLRREFEARLPQPTRGPDPAEQQRQRQQLEQQRQAEIDQLEAAGNYKGMAAAAARHVREDNDARFNHLAAQTRDSSDRSDFRALCAEKPVYAGIRDDVEATIANLRQQGNYIATREQVAKFILGERVVNGAGRARGQQTRRAAEGVARERVRAPSGARSDVRPGTGRRGRNFNDLSVEEMEADLTRRGG